MELSSETIHDIIHPTAAFSYDNTDFPRSPVDSPREPDEAIAQGITWSESPLNPKNRVDSLELPKDPLWRIDGCTGLGSQFYLVPLFIKPAPPFRIDVFIPPQTEHSRLLRDILDLDVAFHTKDRVRVNQLAITRHIIRKLQKWTNNIADPATWYTGLRFGSRIVFRNLSLDLDQISVEMADTWYLERQLFSLPALTKMWGEALKLPSTVDISEVHVVEQLHDSVCLVQIDGKPWILKALTSYTKYLYHELKNLLTLVPHPNLLRRPEHLVTKLCAFGPSTKVIGFTVEYHQQGALRDIVPRLQIHDQLPLGLKAMWGVQLAQALLHLRETTGIYYPDLRLDNIVLSDAGDAIMIDFEQRGVWAEFGAPETNAIDYIRILATDEQIPEHISNRYHDLLESLLPKFESLLNRETYTNAPGGYNIAWLCLDEVEQEACEVYMLGRVLWCLFEGVSAPHRSAVWQSYRFESDIEFPEFRRTPPDLRPLVEECTRGWREPLSSLITRQGSQLVLRKNGPGTEADIRQLALKWWTAEVKEAEEFLKMRQKQVYGGGWPGNYFGRPRMEDVIRRLMPYAEGHMRDRAT